ncbi:MAG TPA: hypothetical protein VGO63_00200 [Candidatus Paceibacterota bacterium]|jgi:hypothetical protein|nr:hypothetical protein [Candidatus Paceibacterota bacterium]
MRKIYFIGFLALGFLFLLGVNFSLAKIAPLNAQGDDGLVGIKKINSTRASSNIPDAGSNSESAVETNGAVSIGDIITGATQGSVLFAGPSGTLSQDNTGFYYDSPTKRMWLLDSGFTPFYIGNTVLSIGSNTPINDNIVRGINIYVDSNSGASQQLTGISPRVNFSGSGGLNNNPVSTAVEAFNTNVGATAAGQYMQGVEAVVTPTLGSNHILWALEPLRGQ